MWFILQVSGLYDIIVEIEMTLTQEALPILYTWASDLVMWKMGNFIHIIELEEKRFKKILK